MQECVPHWRFNFAKTFKLTEISRVTQPWLATRGHGDRSSDSQVNTSRKLPKTFAFVRKNSAAFSTVFCGRFRHFILRARTRECA